MIAAPKAAARAPVLEDIVRQHAEMAAFLWTVYDKALLDPADNPDMDEEGLARLVERLEAYLDGVRVAGADGQRIAEERFKEFPEAGELFVLRMLAAERVIPVVDLDLGRVRAYLAERLGELKRIHLKRQIHLASAPATGQESSVCLVDLLD